MSKYTHEFCKRVLDTFNELYRAKDAVEDIKSELNPNPLSVGGFINFDFLNADSPYNKEFAAFLDDIEADAELRDLITSQNGGPVENVEFDLRLTKMQVSELREEVEKLKGKLRPTVTISKAL